MSDSKPVYRVTDRDGNVIEPGDRITDFRGDPAWFQGVARGPEYNGTAKVVTSDGTPGGERRERYATVYGLTVTPVDGGTVDDIPCPFHPGNHPTRSDVDACGMARIFGG